jgi:DNA invertase Pin-like site-specific DNA recombinase
VHSFSRFFRDGATTGLTIRKLRRHGVEVVSMTQPTGTDPSQEMMRQIIGIFDEYTSKENGKNVTRAMKENAKQGFWNGAAPPLGYTMVEAGRRGQKIKKHLAVEPIEAETVRLIFRLYVEGDTGTGTPPQATVKWLNSRGYQTKAGRTFGVGPMHHILTNTVYVGRWCYNARSARTGERKLASEIVEIASGHCGAGPVRSGPGPACGQQSQGHTASRGHWPDPPDRTCQMRPLLRGDDRADRNLLYGARLRLLHMCKPCAEGTNRLQWKYDPHGFPG